jgi:hypothetical protein
MTRSDHVAEWQSRVAAGQRVALCVVIGPEDDDLRELCDGLGGAWPLAASLSRQMTYVVACAFNRERVFKRAPMIYGAADRDGLHDAVAIACESLDDVRCLWVGPTDPEGAAVVGEARLADLSIGGEA